MLGNLDGLRKRERKNEIVDRTNEMESRFGSYSASQPATGNELCEYLLYMYAIFICENGPKVYNSPKLAYISFSKRLNGYG